MEKPVQTPDEIRQALVVLRRALEREAEEMAASARKLTDWRYHFRAHPWLSCGVAVAVGFALAPRRRAAPLVTVAASQPIKGPVVVRSQANRTAQRPLLDVALGMAANLATQEAVAFATRHGRALMNRYLDAHQHPQLSPQTSERTVN
jgi:hypothetical protein